MNLAERIKYYRKKAQLTQKELAQKIELSTGAVKQYEAGLRKPKEKTLERLCFALNVDIADLLGLREEIQKRQDRIESNEINFVDGYENAIEQLLFFDSLQKLRKRIDGIESATTRQKIARDLNNIFLVLEEFYKSSYNSRDSRLDTFFQKREKTELELIHFVDDFLEQLYLDYSSKGKR